MIKLPSVLALIFSASAALAAGAPPVLAKLDAVPGRWAEYTITTVDASGKTGVMKMRIAAVGKTPEGSWIESRMTMVSPKPKRQLPPETVKILLDSHEVITRAYVKTPHGVMDMSASMSAASREAASGANATKRKKVGTAKITVPAGTFETVRYAVSGGNVTGDLWTKSGVGPYGLIRQIMRHDGISTTFDLLASGDGAKSEVDQSQARALPSAAMLHPFAAPAAAQAQSSAQSAAAAPAPAAPAPASNQDSSQSQDQSSPAQSVGGFLGRAIKSRLGL